MILGKKKSGKDEKRVERQKKSKKKKEERIKHKKSGKYTKKCVVHSIIQKILFKIIRGLNF